jgi:hypothetical protein
MFHSNMQLNQIIVPKNKLFKCKTMQYVVNWCVSSLIFNFWKKPIKIYYFFKTYLFIFSNLQLEKKRKTCDIGGLNSLHIPSQKFQKVVEKIKSLKTQVCNFIILF